MSRKILITLEEGIFAELQQLAQEDRRPHSTMARLLLTDQILYRLKAGSQRKGRVAGRQGAALDDSPGSAGSKAPIAQRAKALGVSVARMRELDAIGGEQP